MATKADKVVVLRVTFRNGRKSKVMFCEDGYAVKAGSARMRECVGWDVTAVEEMAAREGWPIEKRIVEVMPPG